ncbi:Retrovirus-related Pol polyprotein from transposon RE1-like protein [Drosera capensis]
MNGVLHEELYMEQPPGFIAQWGKVCHLCKTLYRLKQFPRTWFDPFSYAVVLFGMKRCNVDHSIFSMSSPAGLLLLVVYVDDIVVTESDADGIIRLKRFLQTEFGTKDLGLLRYFFSIEVTYASGSIVLSQRKYTLDILKEVGLQDARSSDTYGSYNAPARDVMSSYTHSMTRPNNLNGFIGIEVKESYQIIII